MLYPRQLQAITKVLIAVTIIIFVIPSCTTKKNFVYLNDISYADTLMGPVRPFKETLIEPDDQLSIQVSAYNPDDVQMFNTMLSAAGGMQSQGIQQQGNGGGVPSTLGYLVDKRGMITLPYIGEFLAAGLTIREMEIYLGKQLERFVKQPIVKVRFLNHYVNLIGDATSSKVIMNNERMTLFDLLAQTGDLRPSSYRDNILVVREDKGYRVTGRVNLLSKKVYDNPFFYLQNKDMIYVEPIEASYTLRNDRFTRYFSLITGIFGVVVSIITFIIR